MITASIITKLCFYYSITAIFKSWGESYLSLSTGVQAGGCQVRLSVSNDANNLATAWAAGVVRGTERGISKGLRCLIGEPTVSLTSRPKSSASDRPSRDDALSKGLMSFTRIARRLLAARSSFEAPASSVSIGTGEPLLSVVERDCMAALMPLLLSSIVGDTCPAAEVETEASSSCLLAPRAATMLCSFSRSARPKADLVGSTVSPQNASSTVLSHSSDVYSTLNPFRTSRPSGAPHWPRQRLRISCY